MLSERAASNAVVPPPAQPVAHQVAMVLAAPLVAAVALALRAPAAVILLPVVKADDALMGRDPSPRLGKACLCGTCFVLVQSFKLARLALWAQLESSKLIVSVLAFSNTTVLRSSRASSLVARVHLRQWPSTKTRFFEHATNVVCMPVCACIALL